MSEQTQHHRGTVRRTTLVLLILHATATLASARPREAAAPHMQLHDAPEQELPALLERVAKERESGGSRAAAALAVAKLLEHGHSDAVTDRALDALAALGAPQTAPILSQYAQHRRPAARARAFTALGRIAGSDRALRGLVADGLRDSAPEVRAASARALLVLRATEATDLLLRALGLGVAEAAVTLGTIGKPDSLESYSAHLKRQPLEVMLGGYARYLQRADLTERAKLDIVARLEDVAGPAVLQFLSGVARQREVAAPVRRAAAAATLRLAKAVASPAAPEVNP